MRIITQGADCWNGLHGIEHTGQCPHCIRGLEQCPPWVDTGDIAELAIFSNCSYYHSEPGEDVSEIYIAQIFLRDFYTILPNLRGLTLCRPNENRYTEIILCDCCVYCPIQM